MTKIPKIKDVMWELIQFYLKNYKERFNITDFELGVKLLNELNKDPLISKYQWNAISRGTKYSLFNVFCKHFMTSFIIADIKGIEKDSGKNVFTEENLKSKEFEEFYDNHFKILEKKIFLNDEFEYLILIPTFRIYFPEEQYIIELDPYHKIRNIFQDDYPYGQGGGISEFKKAPRYWEPYKESGTFSKANASFEIIYKVKKKLASEPEYGDNFTPYFPHQYNEFHEKVRSLHDFFVCYSPEVRFLPFTFGFRYFIKLPPFSQLYTYAGNYMSYEFSYPAGMLSLKKKEILEEWINCWNSNYSWFYNTFYKRAHDPEPTKIFRYTLDVLRTIDNIPYIDMKIFLLVSTLEGLLFEKSIQRKVFDGKRSSNKSKPVAKAFVQVSYEQNKKWRFLVDEAYFKSLIFNQKGHDQDVEDFIVSAFQYRNNIAHPEKKRNITFKPKNLYDNYKPNQFEDRFFSLILDKFKLFLKFLIKTWIGKQFGAQSEWYQYLDSLFHN